MKITIELDTNSSEDIAILEDILGKSRKKGKRRSDLTAEQKAAIVARLEEGKRRKAAERALEQDTIHLDPPPPDSDDPTLTGDETEAEVREKVKEHYGVTEQDIAQAQKQTKKGRGRKK